MQKGLSIRQVVKVWRSESSGTSRVAVRRLRYRVVGEDWGHSGGGGRGVMRISETSAGADACAVAAICISLLAAEPDDAVFIIAPQSVADLIGALVQADSVAALPEFLQPYVVPHLSQLASASVEVRSRQGLRDLFPEVAASRPAESFLSLEAAHRSVLAGIASRDAPPPVEITDTGWVTDWGRSRKYGGAAVAFVLASGQGPHEDSVRVMAVPQAPKIADGELAAVLAAYAYGRVTGQDMQVFYTDSRDTRHRLRRYVNAGRPDEFGTLLAELSAPFTDAELLSLDVRWVYRGLARAQRLADIAARQMSRQEEVPSEAILELEWLLQVLGSLS